MSWAMILGYFTGLRLVAPHMDGATLVRTVVLVHACDAVMCRLFAHNSGYAKNRWTVLGLLFGVWALAILIVLPSKRNI